MFSRNRFSEITESLKSGFFADNVILTLARAKRRGGIEEPEKKILEGVIKFFNDVLEGYAWSQRPKLTMHSSDSAEAFSKASRVLHGAGSSEAFRANIEALMGDAKKVHEDTKFDEGAADRLIEFFTGYGQLELQRTDDLINPKGEAKTKPWMVDEASFAL